MLSLRPHDKTITSIVPSFINKESIFVTASLDSTVQVRKFEGRLELLAKLTCKPISEGVDCGVTSLAVSCGEISGRLIAAGCKDGGLRLFSREN